MRKEKKKHQIDMLKGPLIRSIFIFAIPLAISSILQQLFNAIDLAVVGQFATSQDQAAVGCNGPVINLLVNLFVGMSIGTNVVVANYLGQRNHKKVEGAVHTSILIAFFSGLILFVLGIGIARPVLELMKTPADTLELAILYLRIYFIGMPFFMVYNFGAAILRSVGDTKRPLYCLIFSGILNAMLNMLLVIVFGMGVEGVAIATTISNGASAAMVLYILFHEKSEIRLERKKLRIHGSEFKRIFQIGMPAGLQGMVFSLSNVFIQMALNGLGSDAVAGSAVTMNYEYMTYFVISAFNQAAVTFISQNYGAKKIDRCKKVFRICLCGSAILTGMLSGIIVLNSHFFASLFTAKATVIAYARMRMKILLTVNFIASSYEVAGSALRGLGYSMTPALLTVFGTCVFRVIWIYTVFQGKQTFQMLLYVYPVSWVVSGVAVLGAYVLISRRIYSNSSKLHLSNKRK